MVTANVRKVFAIALVLVALASIFVPAASAGTRQLWYLCPNADVVTGGDLEKSPCGEGSDDIPDDYHLTWGAGPAQCNLDMGKGTWTIDLDYDAPSGGGTSDINVFLSTTRPDHPLLASATGVPLSAGSNTLSLNMEGAVDEDFIPGDYILLVIHWYPTSSGSLAVNCGAGKSTLRGPDSDPGFPVPELSTVALYSVGLLALVGYVGYRRRER